MICRGQIRHFQSTSHGRIVYYYHYYFDALLEDIFASPGLGMYLKAACEYITIGYKQINASDASGAYGVVVNPYKTALATFDNNPRGAITMKKLFSEELMVAYSTISVYDTEIESPYNQWTDRLIQQGFAWRKGSVSFATIGSTLVNLEIFLSERAEVLPITQRAIVVPFTIGACGRIAVSDDTDDYMLDIPSGDYALLFENGFRSDVEFSEQEDELKLRPMWSRLTFRPSLISQAEIVREEMGAAETPLSPTYPLIMEAESQ